ncbi:MAG: hypothetical protein KF789_03200 [Bdellovibrionaceae bacterium]|nr:hypothetical protein [Pseudobdellovibrionaceae bacterium]
MRISRAWSLLGILIFILAPLFSVATENCPETPLKGQKKDACLIECESYYVENPDARPASMTGVCESTGEFLSSGLNLQRNLDRFTSCAGGVWKGVLSIPDQLKAYLLLAESLADRIRENSVAHQKFIAECRDDMACRREVARLQLHYSARRPDGSYVVPDSVVDADTGKEDFMVLLDRTAMHQQGLARTCELQLSDINRSIQGAEGFEEWNLQALQERYRRVAKWDPGCPGALKMSFPTEMGPSTPGRGWLESLGIKQQCYSPEKFNELVCLEIASFVLDPVAIGTGGAGLAVKAIKKAGLKIAGKGVATKGAAAATRDAERLVAANELADVSGGISTAPGKKTDELIEAEERVGSAALKKTGDPRTPGRDSYIGANLEKEVTTPTQNEEWIRTAEVTGAGSKTRFFEVENSVMKDLNDGLKDKNLVTSLTNRHKEMMMKKVREIEAKNPGLKVEAYSDFKSVRFAFKGKIPGDLQSQLDLAFQSTNAQFAKELKDLNLLRASDTPESWFRAGYASTADEASAAARVGRDQGSANRMMSADQEGVRTRLGKDLSQSEEMRTALEKKWGSSPVLTGAAGTKVPARETFELVRKAKTPDELVTAVKARYGIKNFSVDDAKDLMAYSKSIDSFSPSLRIAKRDVNNLDEAVYGGFSADFDGLGAGNSHATAAALAGKKDVKEALVSARLGEKDMTTELKGRMSAFHKAVGDVAKCSGDDCIGIAKKALSTNDKVVILQKLAAQPETRGIRMAFVQAGVKDSSHRTVISTHGESIEKALRAELKDVIPYERTKGMTFGIDMKTPVVNQGSVDVLIGTRPGLNLTAEEAAKIREALQKAVKKVNEQLTAEGQAAVYRAVP